MSNDQIMELKQRVALLEASLTDVQQENEIWNRLFLEVNWGMVVVDAKSGKALKVNRSYAEMHGYSPLELIGKSVYGLVCAPGHKNDLLEVDAKIHNEDRYYYNSVHVKKDGSPFPVRINNQEVTVKSGRFRIISTWDITDSELKQRELSQYRESLEELVKFRADELERINEQLRSEIRQKENAEHELARANQEMFNILESIGDCFKAVNRDWVITYANQAMVKAREDNGLDGNLVGADYWEVHKDSNPRINEACLKVMNDGVPTRFETYAYTIGKWTEVSIYPTASGISIFLRNIEARRKMEKAIEDEHRRLYSLFNSFPGLIYLQEENHKIRYANHSFQAKFGSCIDKHCYEVIVGLPGPCHDCISEVILNNLTPMWREMVSDSRIYEVYSQPFIDADGSRLVFKVLIDVTDRRSADRELARLERLNMVGEMAAGIAHEVRNPLTTVRGFLQLLQSKEETSAYHDYFQLMTDELDRANLILTDFLSLARDKSVEFEPINISNIVRTLAPLLNSDAFNQDKTIVLELEEVPDLLGNGNELRQLILNLARNGLEATPAGTTLTISSSVQEKCIVLKVRDQGRGVDPEILDRLGTPFLTTKESGTGLGLAICQSIAVRHKASINFDSQGTGTTVIVKFPIN
ncbi:ATP-binding protein [Desulfosporosinus meridiei]|uniref:histidine kinase n=1 Tax=Desulfosporosinus meridiei (strain ATCC BAA-275 / DSM 13257 / KCTC 12902 / NCIMB 13706 / S10) TaxID=768704 RepID=J7IVS3_DESMD|nr:ATP-binding protein [Desulfosporosinus meridiei]AFQ42786.1 PAS domain S-box [Desulfosporosinus meridiei DSM 13257]